MKATFVGNPPGAEGLPARLDPLFGKLGPALSIENCSLSIMLADDAGIRDYNQRFRNVDEPTDVLAFPTGSGDAGASGHYLGDLVISVERATAQAAEIGHGLAEEMEVLLLHGVLHLLGHDHETDGGEMRELESRLASELLGGARGLVSRGDSAGS